MLIGIRPINDFAFKKTFGSPENKRALISLLNSILELPKPFVDVTIENPYNLQDFKDNNAIHHDLRASRTQPFAKCDRIRSRVSSE